MADVMFPSKREEVLQEFVDKRKKFVATTKPYKSTRTIIGNVVDAGNGAAYVVVPKQELTFFNYSIGSNVTDGISTEFAAPDSWTNMQKSSSTNGATRFVIEGISCTWRNPRLAYPTTPPDVTLAALTDQTVRAFVFGNQFAGVTGNPPPSGLDPAALIVPPQLHSPFNLEAPLAQAIAKTGSLFITFDQERTDYIGTLDEFPEGGASSYLRANGQPRCDNRYRIPEGYLWRESGEADSTMNIVLNVREPSVFPITLVTPPGGLAVATPSKVAIDLTLRLHGLAVRPTSGN